MMQPPLFEFCQSKHCKLTSCLPSAAGGAMADSEGKGPVADEELWAAAQARMRGTQGKELTRLLLPINVLATKFASIKEKQHLCQVTHSFPQRDKEWTDMF
eukprot:1137333-Pelagomonas_calceolata.AAC.15